MKKTLLIFALLLSGCVSIDTPPKPAGAGFGWYFSEASAPQFGPMLDRKADDYWQRVYTPFVKDESEIKTVYGPTIPKDCADGFLTIAGCFVPATKTVYINPGVVARMASSPSEYAALLKCVKSHEVAHGFGWHHPHTPGGHNLIMCAPGEGYVSVSYFRQ